MIPAKPPRPGRTPMPWTLDVHTLKACLSCPARVDERCRTADGRPTDPHAGRLAPRLCRCGNLPNPSSGLCPNCARLARETSLAGWNDRRARGVKARRRDRRRAPSIRWVGAA